MHFLKTGCIHLFTNNLLDVAKSQVAKWQPGIDSSCNSSHIASANKEPMTWNFGIGRVISKGAQQQSGHSQHARTLSEGKLRRLQSETDHLRCARFNSSSSHFI